MRNVRRAAVAAALFTVVLAGCGESSEADAEAQGETIRVTHAQGETEVPVNPETVVTFDVGALDTLDQLGVEVDGVPQGFLPDHLAKYDGDDYLNAGTLFEPDYEAVNAAEPDLIIVGGRSAEAYSELERIAPTIDVTLDGSDFLGSFKEQTGTLAEIFEKEAAAATALEALDTKIAATKQATEGVGAGLVVLTTGGEVSAYGPGSRFGSMIHDVLGVEPADPGIKVDTHGEAVSFEYIAETDPDWLFVIDRDVAIGESEGGAAEKVLDNDLVGQTTAWQQQQVVYLDPVRWYLVGSGLNSLDAMVTQIQDSVR